MQPQPLPQRPPKAPRVSLVLALCAALGFFGLLFGLPVALAWDAPLVELPPMQLGNPPPGMETARQRLEETLQPLAEGQTRALRETRAAVHAFGGVCAIASAILLFGAFSAYLRRPGGVAALRVGLILSQASALLGAFVSASMQLALLQSMRPVLKPLLAEGGEVREAALIMLGAQAAAAVITASLMLLLLAFFVWVHRWTRRPAVQRALAPDASA